MVIYPHRMDVKYHLVEAHKVLPGGDPITCAHPTCGKADSMTMPTARYPDCARVNIDINVVFGEDQADVSLKIQRQGQGQDQVPVIQ